MTRPFLGCGRVEKPGFTVTLRDLLLDKCLMGTVVCQETDYHLNFQRGQLIPYDGAPVAYVGRVNSFNPFVMPIWARVGVIESLSDRNFTFLTGSPLSPDDIDAAIDVLSVTELGMEVQVVGYDCSFRTFGDILRLGPTKKWLYRLTGSIESYGLEITPN